MKKNSEQIKQKYNRLAPFFDGLEGILEGLFFKRWRQNQWAKVEGQHILEVGVGTGKNFSFYPDKVEITAIDFSEKMLERARKKRDLNDVKVFLNLMDIETLCYADNSFDTVVASFVFCSVPNPRRGLRELHRVCKQGGKIVLLEHVLSSNRIMASMMNVINPVIVSVFGANINRQTIKSVQACGFNKVHVEHLSSMVKLIEAVK